MPRFLCIDYGLERTGLAISDPEGRLAFPLATLDLKQFGSRSALLEALCQRAGEERAEILVIGLPLYPDGSENLTCKQARNFAARIRRRLELPMYYMPEELSSEEALGDLREAVPERRLRKRARKILDQQAACRILSSFLNLPESKRMPA